MTVDLKPETILLVDDGEDDVFFLKRSLRLAGLEHPTLVAPNVREAIAYLRGEGGAELPSLCAVVMELILPFEDGFELLKWLRAQPHLEGLPIIVLTGSIRKGDLELAHELGASKVFSKTCNPDDLREVADYIKELCPRSGSFHCVIESAHQESKLEERDASELLATLAARLK